MKNYLHFLLIIVFIFCANSIVAQKLFSVSQNNLSQENVTQLKSQIAQSNVSALSLTRNNENKSVYSISLSSGGNSEIIILNEKTGSHITITPVRESLTEFQLAPFFIEELKQAALGEATRYVIVETQRMASLPDNFSVINVSSVVISNDAVYIPRYFYGKKENVKEALPKDRQIVGIYKQKPQLILADPDAPELQHYAAQLEEEMSYYVYMYKLPDGTQCTYDEHFNHKQRENSSSVGNFLEFSLTGVLTDKQRLATEYALELWSEQLAGTVPVDIEVNLVPLGDGILGMSFFPPCFLDYDTDIMYPAALWKQLVGYDANDEWDIAIVMNSKYSFYFGLDGNGGMDYVTIMLHEVTHGLGFGCYCSPDGVFFYDAPGIYDCQLYQGLTGPCFTELPESERAALMVSNNLYSGRPNSNLLEANNGVRVKMYAPTHYSGGSSAHHWDSNVGFINFMGYAYTYPLHTFNNRKIGILTDMGYKVPEIDPNAVWITFYANGGEGNRPPQPFSSGEAQKIKINTFSKTGYSFTGWNTLPDGTGTAYKDRELITIDDNLELYAQWEPGTFTLTFYPNLGTVSPKTKQVVYGSPIGELPIPVRPGFKFDGWTLYSKMITEETIWSYTSDNTAMAKWSVLDAIDETQSTNVIWVYPNPTTGVLNLVQERIEVAGQAHNDVQSVEIFDVYGRKVLEPSLTVLRSYDLTVLSAGIYFVKIHTENGIIMKKVIKN